jgi:hypothetical protein
VITGYTYHQPKLLQTVFVLLCREYEPLFHLDGFPMFPSNQFLPLLIHRLFGPRSGTFTSSPFGCRGCGGPGIDGVLKGLNNQIAGHVPLPCGIFALTLQPAIFP